MFKIITIPAKKGLRIDCKCGYSWTYCGKSRLYCSCPRCRTTITIKNKNKKGSLHADVCVPGSPLHVMTEKTASECESPLE